MSNLKTDAGKLASGLLQSLIAMIEKTPDCPTRERLLRTVETELVKVADHLLQSDPFKGDMEALITDTLRTGSEALMRIVIEQDLEYAAHVLRRINDSSLLQHTRIAQPGLLVYLATEHKALPFGIGNIMAEAARRGDVDLFEKVAAPYHPLEPFWSLDTPEAMNAIDACGPELAPELARRLKAAHLKGSKTCKAFQTDYYMTHDLKALSVFLKAGFDMSQAEEFDVEPLPKELHNLLEQSKSSHGRLALMTQDGSLEDMLARRGDDRTFFGLQSSDGGLRRIVDGKPVPLD